RLRSCTSPQFGSCLENFVIRPKVSGQTLTAVEDGMGWVNAELKKRKDAPPLYCVPDGFGLTGEQILEMLRKEVKENPSSAEESYGLVMLETLEKVFPCNK